MQEKIVKERMNMQRISDVVTDAWRGRLSREAHLRGCCEPKTLVALRYFPYLSPAAAKRCLRRTIQGDSELCNRLAATGYRKYAHCFTPLQVEIIHRYLG